MLLFNDKKYIKTPFKNEDELEQVIISNYEYLFGPSSFYLPKARIKTGDGIETIPDGFVIDISQRIWYVVEVELIHHELYNHIVKQITKQIVASSQPAAKQKIEDLAADCYKNDMTTKEKFNDAKISEINVRKILRDILDTPPIVGIPIDGISNDLREWAPTIKNGVKIWTVSKYAEIGNADSVIYEFPEEYKPQIDTEEDTETGSETSRIKQYDATLFDLIKADMLKPKDTLRMNYKPRGGQEKKYEAVVLEDGSISFLDQFFNSPSYAAIAGIQKAGSDRKTVNGWTSWKTEDGKSLADLRDLFLNNQ